MGILGATQCFAQPSATCQAKPDSIPRQEHTRSDSVVELCLQGARAAACKRDLARHSRRDLGWLHQMKAKSQHGSGNSGQGIFLTGATVLYMTSREHVTCCPRRSCPH